MKKQNTSNTPTSFLNTILNESKDNQSSKGNFKEKVIAKNRNAVGKVVDKMIDKAIDKDWI